MPWLFRDCFLAPNADAPLRRYYPKLTLDFETNKKICDEIAIIASKRLRNKASSFKCDYSPWHGN